MQINRELVTFLYRYCVCVRQNIKVPNIFYKTLLIHPISHCPRRLLQTHLKFVTYLDHFTYFPFASSLKTKPEKWPGPLVQSKADKKMVVIIGVIKNELGLQTEIRVNREILVNETVLIVSPPAWHPTSFEVPNDSMGPRPVRDVKNCEIMDDLWSGGVDLCLIAVSFERLGSLPLGPSSSRVDSSTF